MLGWAALHVRHGQTDVCILNIWLCTEGTVDDWKKIDTTFVCKNILKNGFHSVVRFKPFSSDRFSESFYSRNQNIITYKIYTIFTFVAYFAQHSRFSEKQYLLIMVFESPIISFLIETFVNKQCTLNPISCIMYKPCTSSWRLIWISLQLN